MANVKISELPAASSIAGTELVEVVQGGVSKRATAALLGSVDPTFVRGLRIVWVSANAIDVEPGGAYIESTGRVLNVPAKISRTGLAFTAATWYHVYLYDNAGTPAIELSTTAPAAPFYAQARSKTGDATRRYLGSVLSDSAGTPGLWRFGSRVAGNELEFNWIALSNTPPWRSLAAGTSATPTAWSIASLTPGAVFTTRLLISLIIGIEAGATFVVGVGEILDGSASNPPLTAECYAQFTNGGATKQFFYLPAAWVKLSGTMLQYAVGASGGDLFVDHRGYAVTR